MKGWILIPALAVILIISGCTTQQGEDFAALSPYADIEATVISISLDESGNYYEGDEIIDAPDDSAVITIDKIIETNNANYWTSNGVVEGAEISLQLAYTARPAKIITLVGKTTQSGDTITHDIVPSEISFEDGYFVFKVNGNSESEKTLPGLEEGSKFRTRLSEFGVYGGRWLDIVIGEYEIIS